MRLRVGIALTPLARELIKHVHHKQVNKTQDLRITQFSKQKTRKDLHESRNLVQESDCTGQVLMVATQMRCPPRAKSRRQRCKLELLLVCWMRWMKKSCL